MEHEHTFNPEGWYSTSAVEKLTGALHDIARLMDPTRPALGEPVREYESDEMSDMGETRSVETLEWEHLLSMSCTTTGIYDGATPDSNSIEGLAYVPEGYGVSCHASIHSPVHNQPSEATVWVVVPGDEVPPAILARLAELAAA